MAAAEEILKLKLELADADFKQESEAARHTLEALQKALDSGSISSRDFDRAFTQIVKDQVQAQKEFKATEAQVRALGAATAKLGATPPTLKVGRRDIPQGFGQVAR